MFVYFGLKKILVADIMWSVFVDLLSKYTKQIDLGSFAGKRSRQQGHSNWATKFKAILPVGAGTVRW